MTQTMVKKIKKLFGTKIHISRYTIALVVILFIAFDLRVQSVTHTIVAEPLRADAGEYVLYAYNLWNHGVYSRTDTWSKETHNSTPIPDAVRVPVYPMFVALFLNDNPTQEKLQRLLIAQALISTVTVLLVYLLAQAFVSKPFALAATALTAISPHLITMNIYVLSETLFCFLMVLSLWLLSRLKAAHKPAYVVATGAILGVTSLTHPMALYFVVPLSLFLVYHFGKKIGWRHAAFILIGFVVVCAPWIGRNVIVLGTPGDNSLMLAALRVGAYRDMTYPGHPETRGFPYESDPGYRESITDLRSVMKALTQEFADAPMKQVGWYVFGKPIVLWSWEIIAGEGDVFVYLPLSTPYRYLPHFEVTHALMRILHVPLALLMAAGVLIAWLPRRVSQLTQNEVLGARLVSLLLLYHLFIMVVGFPEPRYSVPMRPFMYAIAMLAIVVGARRIGTVKKTRSRNKS